MQLEKAIIKSKIMIQKQRHFYKLLLNQDGLIIYI
jgi:hypothetical protein